MAKPFQNSNFDLVRLLRAEFHDAIPPQASITCDEANRTTNESGRRFEAAPSFLDFVAGNPSCTRPGFDRGFAILRDGLPDGPAGNDRRRQRRPKNGDHDNRENHLPIITLMPSHTAPTKPVTIIVITALKV